MSCGGDVAEPHVARGGRITHPPQKLGINLAAKKLGERSSKAVNHAGNPGRQTWKGKTNKKVKRKYRGYVNHAAACDSALYICGAGVPVLMAKVSHDALVESLENLRDVLVLARSCNERMGRFQEKQDHSLEEVIANQTRKTWQDGNRERAGRESGTSDHIW